MSSTPKKHHVYGWSLVLILSLAGAAEAAGEENNILSVRLVAAEKADSPANDSALKDVLPLLQKNLKFDSYRLVTTRKQPLRPQTRVTLDFGYEVRLTDVSAQTATVKMFRKRQALLSTRLRLKTGHPVILGGFQHDDDTTLIVVLTLLPAE